ncbi:hypothetical protein CMU45_02725 [Elizabethkingia anophelis]|nr:hypothetical protein [Elizabethkingia anophelis]
MENKPMTAKEKAEELVKKYFDLLTFKSDYKNVKETNSRAYVIFRNMSIECAIISVDELTEENLRMDNANIPDVNTVERLNRRYSFWQEVKSELEKMK